MYVSYLMGVPIINCCLVVAHCALHSGKHTARDFCSIPFGLVQSYIHLLKQASYFGSCFVPTIAAAVLLSAAEAIDADVTKFMKPNISTDRTMSFLDTEFDDDDVDNNGGSVSEFRVIDVSGIPEDSQLCCSFIAEFRGCALLLLLLPNRAASFTINLGAIVVKALTVFVVLVKNTNVGRFATVIITITSIVITNFDINAFISPCRPC